MHNAQSTERSSAKPFQMWQPEAQAVQRLFVDWTAFVHRRIEEDIRLMHDVAKSKSPSDFWKAYFGFWQTAVEDYWKEYATVTQASGGLLCAGDEQAHEPADAMRPKPSELQAA